MKNNNTIRLLRNLIIFMVFSLVVLLPGIASAAGNAVVSVSAPVNAINPGEQFTININVTPNNAIAGMQFNLSFDPSIVTANSTVEGDLLNHGGASTYFNAGQIDNTAGTITGVFGAITSPGQAVSTAGNFAVITLTAKTAGGGCPLTLSNVVIGDAGGQSIPVNVNNATISVNRPPVLASIGNKTVNEGQALTFTISATDPDGNSLNYSTSNLPAGASFNSSTRRFTWTPAYNQSGTYQNAHFAVSDGSLNDTEDITIVVNNVLHPDVNSDGVVNVLDMISVAQHWDQSGVSGWIPEDVNENGSVNVLDVILIGQYWTG